LFKKYIYDILIIIKENVFSFSVISEDELTIIYNPDNIFKNININPETTNNIKVSENNNNTALVEYLELRN